MNKSKCRGCQWNNKPYWSIINPCENCYRDEVQTITNWIDPTINQLQQENKELKEENKRLQDQQKFLYHIRQDTTSIPAVVRKASDEETIKELQQENFKMMKENKQLKERINKSIEYIKENKVKVYSPYGDNEDTDYDICLVESEINELIEILKGESNE